MVTVMGTIPMVSVVMPITIVVTMTTVSDGIVGTGNKKQKRNGEQLKRTSAKASNNSSNFLTILHMLIIVYKSRKACNVRLHECYKEVGGRATHDAKAEVICTTQFMQVDYHIRFGN